MNSRTFLDSANAKKATRIVGFLNMPDTMLGAVLCAEKGARDCWLFSMCLTPDGPG
jgi:hypothetical protein